MDWRAGTVNGVKVVQHGNMWRLTMELQTGLSFGDVLLVPKRSPVKTRSDVDLQTNLTPSLSLDTPVLSAPMDTVTESETACAIAECGGFGTIHRFMTIEQQATEVETVASRGYPVGAAVGIDEDFLSRTDAVVSAGASCVMVDVAHGHLESCLDAVASIDREFDIDLVAGNVVTADGVSDLYTAGADGVKVGVGPGSHCTTRMVTGVGVPQITAVNACSRAAHDLGITAIADGGIRSSGDAVKALMAGADTIMMGGFFAGTDEAPGSIVVRNGAKYKRSRGMATRAANECRSDKDAVAPGADEGVEGLTSYRGPLADAVEEFLAGIRSGLSYCGGYTITAARAKAEFIRTTPAANALEGSHSTLVEMATDGTDTNA